MRPYLPRIGSCLILSTLFLVCLTIVVARFADPTLRSWGLRENETPHTAYRHDAWFGYDRFAQSRSGDVWPNAGGAWGGMQLNTLPAWTLPGDALAGADVRTMVGIGWPFRHVTGELIAQKAPGATTASTSWEGAIVIHSASGAASLADFVIPYRVRYVAMAANVLIWASAALMTTWIAGRIRQSVRGVRGRCRQCGYDLKFDFDTGCPECGWNRRP